MEIYQAHMAKYRQVFFQIVVFLKMEIGKLILNSVAYILLKVVRI